MGVVTLRDVSPYALFLHDNYVFGLCTPWQLTEGIEGKTKAQPPALDPPVFELIPPGEETTDQETIESDSELEQSVKV